MAKPTKHGEAWRIRWIDESGSRKSECFQTYRDAEYALSKHETETDEIVKGLRLPTLPNKTFEDLCEAYLKYRTSQKRHADADESIIRVHLKPFFGSTPLYVVGSKVNAFALTKGGLHPKTLHNILTLLISMLRFANEEKWLAVVPRIKKPRIRLLNSDFRYLRNKQEISQFLFAAKAEGEVPYHMYATAVFTGLRAGELAGLQWSDIDFGKRLILVQRSYDGPTKNGEIRYVPILDTLLPLLLEWRNNSEREVFVFRNEDGLPFGKSARIYQEILHRVLVRAGFAKSTNSGGKTKNYIVFHDLRHTFASHWMMNNGNIFKLQKILGHKSHQMTQRYAHLEPSAFKEDFDRFGSPLEERSTVVALVR